MLQTSSDPLVGLNRGVYAFNNTADKAILRPAATAYSAVVPGPARRAVGHFFSNLGEPLNALNNLLQGKVDGALSSTYRFAVNSTIGVFGLFDVAKSYQVNRKQEDFGQTLAAWGVKPGPYLVLPFLGPSNFRDGFGFAIDNLTFNSATAISDDSATRAGLTVLNVVDIRAGLLGSADLLEHQLDPYIFLKEAYEQNRLNSVYDGNAPVRSDDDLDF
jgi:phospholipid-binding lipoprotein MlaA